MVLSAAAFGVGLSETVRNFVFVGQPLRFKPYHAVALIQRAAQRDVQTETQLRSVMTVQAGVEAGSQHEQAMMPKAETNRGHDIDSVCAGSANSASLFKRRAAGVCTLHIMGNRQMDNLAVSLRHLPLMLLGANGLFVTLPDGGPPLWPPFLAFLRCDRRRFGIQSSVEEAGRLPGAI